MQKTFKTIVVILIMSFILPGLAFSQRRRNSGTTSSTKPAVKYMAEFNIECDASGTQKELDVFVSFEPYLANKCQGTGSRSNRTCKPDPMETRVWQSLQVAGVTVTYMPGPPEGLSFRTQAFKADLPRVVEAVYKQLLSEDRIAATPQVGGEVYQGYTCNRPVENTGKGKQSTITFIVGSTPQFKLVDGPDVYPDPLAMRKSGGPQPAPALALQRTPTPTPLAVVSATPQAQLTIIWRANEPVKFTEVKLKDSSPTAERLVRLLVNRGMLKTVAVNAEGLVVFDANAFAAWLKYETWLQQKGAKVKVNGFVDSSGEIRHLDLAQTVNSHEFRVPAASRYEVVLDSGLMAAAKPQPTPKPTPKPTPSPSSVIETIVIKEESGKVLPTPTSTPRATSTPTPAPTPARPRVAPTPAQQVVVTITPTPTPATRQTPTPAQVNITVQAPVPPTVTVTVVPTFARSICYMDATPTTRAFKPSGPDVELVLALLVNRQFLAWKPEEHWDKVFGPNAREAWRRFEAWLATQPGVTGVAPNGCVDAGELNYLERLLVLDRQQQLGLFATPAAWKQF